MTVRGTLWRRQASQSRTSWSSKTPRFASPVRPSRYACCSSMVSVCRDFKTARHPRDQLGTLERLGEQVGGPQVERSDPFRRRGEVAVEDHGDRLRCAILLDATDQLQAALSGQTHLGQDQVRLQDRRRPHGRDQVVDFGDFQLAGDQLVAQPRAAHSARARPRARGVGNRAAPRSGSGSRRGPSAWDLARGPASRLSERGSTRKPAWTKIRRKPERTSAWSSVRGVRPELVALLRPAAMMRKQPRPSIARACGLGWNWWPILELTNLNWDDRYSIVNLTKGRRQDNISPALESSSDVSSRHPLFRPVHARRREGEAESASMEWTIRSGSVGDRSNRGG